MMIAIIISTCDADCIMPAAFVMILWCSLVVVYGH